MNIRTRQSIGVRFTDDIQQGLEQLDKQEEDKISKKTVKKVEAAPAKPAKLNKKTTEKKVEEDIPMDNEAIKSYSAVIADAAEDSEPVKPVEYQDINTDNIYSTEVRAANPPAK